MLTLALAEDNWVTIGIFFGSNLIAAAVAAAGVWLHLNLRIKAIEINQVNFERQQKAADDSRLRFEERVGATLERTSYQLGDTTKKLDVLIARIEERDRHERP